MRWCQDLLIVGLGNPGSQYSPTRHNVGFQVLDLIARQHGLRWKAERQFQSEMAKGLFQEQPAWLLKPQTYMNESGNAVGQVSRWLRIEPQQVLVISDDVHLPLGAMRLREGGGTGGHNGLKSVQSHLGTTQFPRLRLGVGSPDQGLVDHVLGSFRPEEQETLQRMLQVAAELVEAFCIEGWQGATRSWAQRLDGNAQRQSGEGADGTSMPGEE